MVAEKLDRLRRRADTLAARHRIKTTCLDLPPQRNAQITEMVGLGVGDGALGNRDHIIDDTRHLQMAISRIAIPRRLRCFLIGGRTPFFDARCGGLGQEPCLAQHILDGIFDLNSQRIGNLTHPFDAFGAALQFLQTITDRLFARDVGCRAEYRRQPTRRAHMDTVLRQRPCAIAKTKAWPTWLGIDIDKTSVNFAPCRAIAQRIDGLIERRIGEHRSVDQHGIGGHAHGKLLWQYAFEKCVTAVPYDLTRGHRPVKFMRRKRRERAGKACGCPCCKNQFRDRGQRAAAFPTRGKTDRNPVFALHYHRRAVEHQNLIVAGKIGDGHKQVKRLL